MFDSKLAPVTTANAFVDSQIPKGWAPFGIQALGGNVFVTYAKQDPAKREDVAGGGLGYVDQYSPDGVLLARVAKRGLPKAPLNSPWGLALAPSTFGGFAGDLLVANFGNGKISAYQPPPIAPGKWVYKGQLRRDDRDRQDPGALGDRVRQRWRRRSGERRSTSQPGRAGRRTASSDRSPRGSTDSMRRWHRRARLRPRLWARQRGGDARSSRSPPSRGRPRGSCSASSRVSLGTQLADGRSSRARAARVRRGRRAWRVRRRSVSMGVAGLAVADCIAVSSGTFIAALEPRQSVANVLFMQALAPMLAALLALGRWASRSRRRPCSRWRSRSSASC